MFYAKSNPVESIKEHTDKLLENMQLLKKLYGEQITKEIDIEPERFWKLLEITCKYHDAGKVFSAFQNVIRQKLGEKLILSNFDYDLIKHEQISPMFVPYKEYEMTKNERKLVYQAIYYHHERDQINIDRN